MAKFSFLNLMLLVFLPTFAISSSHSSHHKIHNHYGFKSKHFTLYQQDIFNQTDFIVVVGVGGGTNFSLLTPPFGTVSVLKDNLTLTLNPSSKVVGNTEAFSITSSFDGLDNLSVGRITLQLGKGLSGTISTVGVANTLTPSNVPVTGGTGDFLLVQGFITTSLVSFQGLSFVYKIEFHLYWPPYAPYAIKA